MAVKLRWTHEQDDWLRHCFCCGYSLEGMSRASERSAKSLRRRANQLSVPRPQGYTGKGATKIAARLPLIPAYPGPNIPVGYHLPLDKDGRCERVVIPKHFDLEAHRRPPNGWKRRCEGCDALFTTEDLEQVYCPPCLKTHQATQEKHAKAPRPAPPEKSPMKTSSWLSS